MNKPYALIADVDDTLLGNDLALEEFVAYLQGVRRELALVYASGRMVDSLANIIKATALPDPEFIIAGVGSEIRRFPSLEPLPEWHDRVAPGWNGERVREVLVSETDLVPQPEHAQSAFKVSYFLPEAEPERLHALSALLKDAGVEADFMYSSRHDLDFLPPGVNKGTAAAYLASRWHLTPDHVLVAGNSGNDVDLFRHQFHGIVVGNAHPELKRLGGHRVYLAREDHARGVVEGLKHWLNLLSAGRL